MVSRLGTVLVVIMMLTFLSMLTSFKGSAFALTAEEPEPEPAVLIGAGDISVCGGEGDIHTAQLVAALIDRHPQAAVFTAGDNVQIMGSPEEYTGCFQPSWGRFKQRIHPSPGNHDLFLGEGSGYGPYFGELRDVDVQGYYSYDLGSWHIVSLNSNCAEDGCGEESAQVRWLRQDLQKNQRPCSLLYWHHPLRSSGKETAANGETFWRVASEFGAEVVVNGHDHHYERFTPLDAAGQPDPQKGIRSFIVGTGGAWLFEVGQPLAISAALNNTTHGVILFRLYPGRYDWQYFAADGTAFTDAGSGTCH